MASDALLLCGKRVLGVLVSTWAVGVAAIRAARDHAAALAGGLLQHSHEGGIAGTALHIEGQSGGASRHCERLVAHQRLLLAIGGGGRRVGQLTHRSTPPQCPACSYRRHTREPDQALSGTLWRTPSLGALWPCDGCDHSTLVHAEPAQSDGQLELRLTVPEDPVPVNDDVPITIALVNVGESAIVVNARMLIAPEGTPAALCELRLTVEGPAGYVNRNAMQINAGRPGTADFVELPGGDAIERSYELTLLHSMHAAGRYEVRVRYANGIDLADGQPRSWTGELTSNLGVVERV